MFLSNNECCSDCCAAGGVGLLREPLEAGAGVRGGAVYWGSPAAAALLAA